VGLDVGTTSTQLIVSRLRVENRASGFAVPELEIANREILYRSPVHFTPLLDESHVDGTALRKLVEAEYRAAGISRETVDTGAVIITGETSRKENARAVLDALSDLAGDFVVATAGPDLESVLAARGAGAVAYSEETGKTVLHMDIGGGTSNLALIRDGKIVATTCLNVGGRLIKYGENGVITYLSPVLKGIVSAQVGNPVTKELLETAAGILVEALEMAAGRRPAGELLRKLTTEEAAAEWEIPENAVISFSGGVADCIENVQPWQIYGDLGPVLGQAIRRSALCRGEYVLGQETIRATVIGAGCHSVQLSGSTVFHRNIHFPLKNLPVAEVSQWNREAIRRELKKQDGPAVLAFPGLESPEYSRVVELAEELLASGDGPHYICLEQDMAKALGQAMAVRAGKEDAILCIDRIRVREGTYLDIGAPVGPAMPVVVKTLILGR
jgi:ethanolamine utilization protein EutA